MQKFNNFFMLCVAIFPLFGQENLSLQDFNGLNRSSQEKLFNQLIDSSNTYYLNGDYRKDLELNIDILTLALEIDDSRYIYKGYRNLGYDYLALGNTLLARENFEKSEKHARLSKNDTATAVTYMDLANIYSFQDNGLKQALNYHDKSISLFEKLKDSTGLAKAEYNTILTAIEGEDYNKAYVHIIRARKLIKYGDPAFEVSLDNLMGQYHLEKGHYEMADKYLLKAIDGSKKGGFNLALEDAYYYYGESLYEQGRFEEAFDAKENYEEYLLDNQQKQISTDSGATLANFQLSEYRKEVEAAEIKNKLQSELVESKSRLNIILIIVSTCFVILFLALYCAYRKRKALVQKLKLKNTEYLKAKEESEELSKSKSKFFSTISHELRTPLYGVIGLSTILLEDKALKSHEKDLRSLKFSADYLLALINDVLQINKIDSKNSEDELSAFSIADLIKKIASSFEYMRLQNNNKIHLHISDNVPKLVSGLSVQLSQVLMNLIGNACKFTENGDIYVIAETTKNTRTKANITFHVRDTGIGIPLEKQESIFEEFSQLQNHNQKHQGTGLGLPIVKKLLKNINSDITLKSEAGKGSLFSFTLEFKVMSEAEAIINPTRILDVNSLKGKKILIVEDNRINQTVTKKILEKNRVKTVIAENGLEALNLAKSNTFDLILMDIHMPVKNGIEATREIRSFDTKTPIIALTAVEIEEMRFDIYECGMNDIIVKPYDITKFTQTILKSITTATPDDKRTLKAI